MFKVIRILACISKNNGLGKENRLLYSIPEDMARFKALTTGHTIIMGRRTYESLPNGALPNRRNIVLSRTARDYAGCEVYNSLDEALKHCEGDVYIIGGASVYEEAMNRCDELLLTIVDDVYPDADTFFPDFKEWRLVEREEHEKSESNSHAFAFCKYTL
ncbi:MAG: dihydrofolate reductase [Prevotella sp.]|jgi:dihydrofolate reductase|nr:dihydrofolate reductase [Prevotella sp.]